jgi:predicted nuclease of predicted toxin-antitoxin system
VRIRLFLDEDVHTNLAHALKQRGFDAVHAQGLARTGLTDDEQLAYAVRQRRCLISFNVRDFVLLHNRYVEDNRRHYGIIVSKQLPLGVILNKLLRLLNEHSQDSMKNRIEFL